MGDDLVSVLWVAVYRSMRVCSTQNARKHTDVESCNMHTPPLSRTPTVEKDVMAHFVETAEDMGFRTDDLIYVQQK